MHQAIKPKPLRWHIFSSGRTVEHDFGELPPPPARSGNLVAVDIFTDLLIYWPSAHPATVPGLCIRGLVDRRYSLGSREEPLGGLPGISAVWRPLGGCFGASWGPLGLLGPLGGSLGSWALGLLGPPRSLLGRKGRFFGSRSPLWPALGALLALGAFLGCFEALLGRHGAFLGHLGASWAVLEAILAVLEASWAVWRPSWASWVLERFFDDSGPS